MHQLASSIGQGKARRRLCYVLVSYLFSKRQEAVLVHCKHFAQQFEILLIVSLGWTYLTAATAVSEASSLSQVTGGNSKVGCSSLLVVACWPFICG